MGRDLDFSLNAAKLKFTTQTQNDVVAFRTLCRDFHQSFFLKGPGDPELEVEAGVEMMASYRQKLEMFHSRRDELVRF